MWGFEEEEEEHAEGERGKGEMVGKRKIFEEIAEIGGSNRK